MKSLCIDGNGKVHIEEKDTPRPAPDQVLVKTAVSAVCGSELKAYRGDGMARGNSGHEAAGTVVEIGKAVEGISVGQRVGVSAVVGCGDCPYCAKGQYTWCANWSFFPNMHAEQFVIPARGCHSLPDEVCWSVGALLTGDGLGVPYHTSTKLTDDDIETVVVWGLGPIGLGNVLVQAHAGRRVVGVDLVDARRQLATVCGAAHALDGAAENVIDQIRDLTDGEGADAAVEAVGRPETVKQCIAAVRKGGKVVLNGEQPSVELSPSNDFIRRDITVAGAWYYHFHEFSSMLDLYRNGLPVERLITDSFAFADAAKAFAAFAGASTGKVMLRYAD